MSIAITLIAWIVALIWWSRALPALLHLREVPDLHTLPQDASSQASVTVIVPARNEAASIEATLRSLLAQDHPHLHILAVDDRSSDTTGLIMDHVAAGAPQRLHVLHIRELPSDWTGKVYAMATAARTVETDWLLFTDGDVRFAPSTIRLSLAMAEKLNADHLVTVPTMDVLSYGEGAMLGFFQTFAVWVSRPWKVPDPGARRDVVGIGAFNMIRRAAYQQVGGFDAMPMEIGEDMRLAQAVKYGGLRSRIAFGRDLVRIHWAAGIRGLVNTLTKNTFAGFGFSIRILAAACLWILVFSVAPVLGLFFAGTRLPAALTLAAILSIYAAYAGQSKLSLKYFLAQPFAAAVFVFTLLRSMFVTLRNGGVEWRGTFYPLGELRARARPMW